MAHDEKEIAYRESIKAALLAAERDVGIAEICAQCDVPPPQYSRFKKSLQLGRDPLNRCKAWLKENSYWPPPDEQTPTNPHSAHAQWSIIAADFRQLADILGSDAFDDEFKAERFAYIVGSYHAQQQSFTESLVARIKDDL